LPDGARLNVSNEPFPLEGLWNALGRLLLILDDLPGERKSGGTGCGALESGQNGHDLGEAIVNRHARRERLVFLLQQL
jgi:hypothetical protein